MSTTVESKDLLHYVKLGRKVPDRAAGLAFLTILNPIPENTLRIIDVWKGTTSNRNAAAYKGKGGSGYDSIKDIFTPPGGAASNYGADVIRILNIVNLNGNIWLPRISNGSFFIREVTIDPTDTTDPLPTWVDSSWSSGDTVVWFYSVPEYDEQPFSSRDTRQISVGSGAKKQINYDTPSYLGPNTFRLHFTPLVKNTSAIQLWVRGEPFEGSISIVDADKGIIRTSVSIGAGIPIYASYQYYEYGLLYKGFYDSLLDTYMYLDLNPTVGHYCMTGYYTTATETIRPDGDVLTGWTPKGGGANYADVDDVVTDDTTYIGTLIGSDDVDEYTMQDGTFTANSNITKLTVYLRISAQGPADVAVSLSTNGVSYTTPQYIHAEYSTTWKDKVLTFQGNWSVAAITNMTIKIVEAGAPLSPSRSVFLSQIYIEAEYNTPTVSDSTASSEILMFSGSRNITGIEFYVEPSAAYNVTRGGWSYDPEPHSIKWTPSTWELKNINRQYQTLGYGYLGNMYLGQMFIPLSAIDTSAAYDMSGKRVPKGLVFARIYADPSSIIENMAISDTRSMGGGLQEDADLRKYTDSRYYFDIGGIEGPSISENGLLIFRIPRDTFISYGDRRVRDAIEKFLAAGTAYLLEII